MGGQRESEGETVGGQPGGSPKPAVEFILEIFS